MKTLTLSDIPAYNDEIDLDGLFLKFEYLPDENEGKPWEESDGHGPVSEWTRRDKRAGEIVLCSDDNGRSKLYYDFAEAMKLAKRDKWDAEPFKTGTKGEQAERAVKADFEYLRLWCNDQWQHVTVRLTLVSRDDDKETILLEDYLGGVENYKDFHKECALSQANELLANYARSLASYEECSL